MVGVVNYHGLEHNPVGLWQFNGTMNDTSGNGFNMTVDAGTIRYANLLPTLRGALLVSTRLIYNTFTSTLAITGDITIECLINLPAYLVSLRDLVSHENAGETSADNSLYGIDLISGSGNVGFFSENGAGVDQYYALTERPPLNPFHFAATRTSNVIQFYQNGRAWGSPSGTLTTPSGGGSGRLRVGLSGSLGPEGVIASLKIIAAGLNATQVASEYNRTLGGLYGYV